jgi:hypothetical protein
MSAEQAGFRVGDKRAFSHVVVRPGQPFPFSHVLDGEGKGRPLRLTLRVQRAEF